MTPVYDAGGVQIYQGDCRAVLATLPAESVQCVVTSPPYYGLRRYAGLPDSVWGGEPNCDHSWNERRYYTEKTAAIATAEAFSEPGQDNIDRLKNGRWKVDSTCSKCGAWLGCLGNEPTVELFLAHLVEVFRAVRRVLRRDGVCWVNLGDSYAGNSAGFRPGSGRADGIVDERGQRNRNGTPAVEGIAQKNLLLIPERFAIAAQQDGAADPKAMRIISRIRAALLRDYDSWDEVPANIRREVEKLDREHEQANYGGWYVRSRIVWAKTSAMPESVQDRPTSAHETIWLLAKGPRYFYDAEAVRVKNGDETPWEQYLAAKVPFHSHGNDDYEGTHQSRPAGFKTMNHPNGANLRNTWLDVDDRADLSDLWVLGPEPYKDAHFATFPTAIPKRAILAGTSERGQCPQCGAPWRRVTETKKVPRGDNFGRKDAAACLDHGQQGTPYLQVIGTETIGWQPSCRCNAPVVPCTVLDPFLGSGTTAAVARALGRRCIGIEASAEYVKLAIKRIDAVPLHLSTATVEEAKPEQLALMEVS